MKDTYEFTYRLNYDEIYNAFLLVSMKWSKKARKIIGAILTAIAVGMLIAYYLDSRKIHYFFIVILAILMLYYLIYVPVLKAKRGAQKVFKQNGTYKVKITNEGKIILSGAATIDIAGDKDARAIETETLYVIRPDNRNTVCLPKRIMRKEEVEEIREILKACVKYQIR